jgi:hypothetical protein
MTNLVSHLGSAYRHKIFNITVCEYPYNHT